MSTGNWLSHPLYHLGILMSFWEHQNFTNLFWLSSECKIFVHTFLHLDLWSLTNYTLSSMVLAQATVCLIADR